MLEAAEVRRILRMGGFPPRLLEPEYALGRLDALRVGLAPWAEGFVTRVGGWLSLREKDGDRPVGALLHGPSDSGKTTLAVALASLLRTHLTSVHGVFRECGLSKFTFVDFMDLTEAIKSTYGPGGGPAWGLEWMERIRSETVFLVLDDLGAEAVTAWTARRLYMILDRWDKHELPLVVTTNYAPQQLSDRIVAAAEGSEGKILADRIMSRLHRNCEFVEVG